ncbi:MAG: DUF1501 domain-containing protein [Planctomycetes bacterium]|nr:DUF1501 domain-containing protein [Planctomycetota bacterium]
MSIDRRRFLQASLGSAALCALGPNFGVRPWSRALAQVGTDPAKKLLVIFLRGGNDGLNTCIPYGDPEYNATHRPTIFVPETSALDLGNGFAALHPALQPLHELHLLGQLATIHRVAYDNQSRSHFDSQQFWENAVPGDNELDEGWIYRHVVDTYDLADNPLAAASISARLMVLFQGEVALPHIFDLATYDLGVPGTASEKLLGTTGSPGSGVLGWYEQYSGSTHGYDALLATTGETVGQTLAEIQASGVDPATYVPENGATYPNDDDPAGFPATSFPFFRQLRDAVMLLKATDMRIAAVELDGFDTHAGQGSAAGSQAQLLSWVAHGIRSVSLDMDSTWSDTAVVTLSEFGRTSKENGSGGTDHAEASCLFVASGSVNGGVYNCDATTWAAGDLFSTPNGRYVSHRTDYRSVIAEIMAGHFGVANLDAVVPSYSTLATTPSFAPLGLFV